MTLNEFQLRKNPLFACVSYLLLHVHASCWLICHLARHEIALKFRHLNLELFECYYLRDVTRPIISQTIRFRLKFFFKYNSILSIQFMRANSNTRRILIIFKMHRSIFDRHKPQLMSISNWIWIHARPRSIFFYPSVSKTVVKRRQLTIRSAIGFFHQSAHARMLNWQNDGLRFYGLFTTHSLIHIKANERRMYRLWMAM